MKKAFAIPFRDPISGLTHLFGALIGVWGLVYLIRASAASGNSERVVPFAIFGAGVIAMYSTSALYHWLHVSDEVRKILRRVDHTMIFLLIAGSYTPFCMITLRDSYGPSILATVWSIAILGLLLKLFWLDAPRWFSTGLYVGMGWIAMIAIYPLIQRLSTEGLVGLLLGGVFYTVGALIYALKRPDPFPPHFGFHEIWHLFVLAGTGAHFYSVCTLL